MSNTEESDNLLRELLLNTNEPLAKIAKELGWTQYQLNKRMKQLGLTWVKRHHRKLSRGHSSLLKLMQQLLPGEEIIVEHHIGERLMLDIYCPSYKLAAEFHGRQHFEFVPHFHGDKQEFYDSQDRDQRKVELCKENGIALVVFRYNDSLTEEVVFERMIEAIREVDESEIKEKEFVSKYKDNPYYERMKQKSREYRKAQYERLKKQKKKQQKNRKD